MSFNMNNLTVEEKYSLLEAVVEKAQESFDNGDEFSFQDSPGPVRTMLTLEGRDQAPSSDATAELPDDTETVVAAWSRTGSTATADIATGTPQVLRMQFPDLSA